MSAPRSRRTPWTATSTSAGATRTRAAAGAAGATRSPGAISWRSTPSRIAEEAVALLTAPQCPSGRFTIVLDPSQVYLQMHESCGHPTELDRVMAAKRPTRAPLPDHRQARGRAPLRLGPVDIVADATAPGGMGTFGWDDEGVAAQAVPLDQGRDLRRLPVEPRDGDPDRPPERRRHAGRRLEPDPAHPDDQHQPAAEARDEPRRDRRRHRRRPLPRDQPSWSIDDRRLNFQFATEIA